MPASPTAASQPISPPGDGSPALPSWVGLVLGLSVLGALVARTNFLIDDAYISFRYARNWADLGLPTYNPGTAPPVEGYSNTLWVLLLRACAGLSLNLEICARVLSCLFAAGTLTLVHLHLGRLALAPWPRLFATVSLAAFPPFAVWTTGGLETASFGFFVFSAYITLTRAFANGGRGAGLAGVLGLAVCLSRVEGPLWALGIVLAAGIAGKGKGVSARSVWPYLALTITGYGLFLLWRHATFGEWMANTVHAKGGLSLTGVSRGLKTSATFLILFPSTLVALAAFPRLYRTEHRKWAAGALTLLGGFLGYNTLVGGDWMPFFRFLAPASPFIAVLLGLFLNTLRQKAVPIGLLLIGISLPPLFGQSLAPNALLQPLYFRTFKVGYETEWQRWKTGVGNLAMFKMLGRGLRQVADPADTLTFGAIGAVGYESRLHIHDRNGLVDREVAMRVGLSESKTAGHDKQVPRAWFLNRNPTLFHAVVIEGPVGPEGSNTYQRAVALATSMIEQRVFGDPAEAPLRDKSYIQVHRLKAELGIPKGSLLVLLRARD
jgi:hypothetical protein